MRGSEKEREKERVLGDWNDDEKEEEEEGLFVDEDNDREEEEGLFVGCVICFLFESFSISIPRFASFSILSPFSNPFTSFTSFGLCIGFNVPNRTDEHPNRKEIARIGEPSSMDSWLQYAAPDP